MRITLRTRALLTALLVEGCFLAGYVWAAEQEAGSRSAVPEQEAEARQEDVWEPVRLGDRRGGVILMPDGTLKSFYAETAEGGAFWNFSVTSPDGGITWSAPTLEYEGPRAFLPLRDREGEFHLFPMIVRRAGEGRTIGVDYFIDIWHIKTRDGGTAWEEAKVIFEGYVGSINGVTQLSTGRIVLPFAEWLPDRKTGPPCGANVVTCVYSDDGGDTWHKSPAQLTAPTHTDFNGSGYGACEPCIIELKDGRVYMLARTDAGCLYESYSPDGAAWEPLRPTEFLGTDAPAGFLRLPDDRILVFWNGCEKPPRVHGAGVYGGRDALHAAISDDEGRTWRGYREIYRDPTRNNTPPKSGDRGTAYPYPYLAPNGKVIVMTGQGPASAMLRFDPDWLLGTHREDDFSAGLDGWSVFTHYGEVSRWWQDRRQGPAVVELPEARGGTVLHVRRPDDYAGDGAVWNFRMGRKGVLTLRVLLREGFGGAVVSLLDRFFDPTDPNGEKEAVFSLPIQPDGHISVRESLEAGTWCTLQMAWDTPGRTAVASVDDVPRVYLPRAFREPRGVNYVRIRSTATAMDEAGLYVDYVSVDVSDD